ncbi:MAG: hypothetical protein M1819_001227 [Sarea resinae]|nr:MAG: hypothetical protein M1819_001227 [Sarea resinae]
MADKTPKPATTVEPLITGPNIVQSLAGLSPRSGQRPNPSHPTKRQKPNGPYDKRHSQQQSYNVLTHAPQGYPSGPVNWPPLPPQHAPYGGQGPPTPMSADSAKMPPWKQPPPAQYIPSYPHYEIGEDHPSIGPPTPVTAYNSQHSSPASAGLQQHQSSLQSRHDEYRQPSVDRSHGNHYLPLEPTPPVMSPEDSQRQLESGHTTPRTYSVDDGKFSSRDTRKSFSSIESTTRSADVSDFVDDESFDIEWEEYAFDSGCKMAQTVHTVARTVHQPLPATFDEEDHAQTPLAVDVQSGPKLLLQDPRSACLSIRQTVHWTVMQCDPVFRVIPEDSECIPLEELIAARSCQRSHLQRDKSGHYTEELGGRSSANGDGREENVVETVEHNKAACGDVTTITPDEPWQPPLLDKEAEARLAALGVTGIPKPVEEYVTPPPDILEMIRQGSLEAESQSRGRSRDVKKRRRHLGYTNLDGAVDDTLSRPSHSPDRNSKNGNYSGVHPLPRAPESCNSFRMRPRSAQGESEYATDPKSNLDREST